MWTPCEVIGNVGGLTLVVPHSPDPIVLQLQPGMIRSGVACTPSPSGLADLGCEAMVVYGAHTAGQWLQRLIASPTGWHREQPALLLSQSLGRRVHRQGVTLPLLQC